MPRALMLVASNASDETRLADFHAWYELHVEELLQLDGIRSASRWQASRHQLLPGADGIEGRRFLALYEIETDDLEALRDRIRATAGDRTHSDLLEVDPLPVTLLFEHLSDSS